MAHENFQFYNFTIFNQISNSNFQSITVYFSLGSNIDDRLAYLNSAKQELNARKDIEIKKESQVYETEPCITESKIDEVQSRLDERKENCPHIEEGQEWFLNQVIKVETSLTPEELLDIAQKIEKKLGRTKKNHLGPREIDIDILLYGSDTLSLPHLQIPHRHMQDRRFVLEPLVELEPNLKDPISGQKYADILGKLGHEYEVTPFL